MSESHGSSKSLEPDTTSPGAPLPPSEQPANSGAVTSPNGAAAGTSAAPATATPNAAKPAAPGRDKHLYQLDLVRLITFASVIFDHVMLHLTSVVSVAAGCLEMYMRYTRNSFFALTGFVLVYQYQDRKLDPIKFWKRRYKLIGIPYVMWSLFYWCFGRWQAHGWDGLFRNFESLHSTKLAVKSIAYDLVTGNAFYHMYFLFVSMQIYLIFPLLLWFLKKTRGWHWLLLAVSFGFHLWLMYAMLEPPHGFLVDHTITRELWFHLTITVIPYQFYILLGCLAAMHYRSFQTLMLRWRLVVIGIGLVVGVATALNYLNLTSNYSAADLKAFGFAQIIFRANNVFRWENTFLFIATIATLYAIGTIWQQRRREGSLAASFLSAAADRSFAVYLAHALALDALKPTITRHDHGRPVELVIICSFIATVLLTIIIVEALRRSPLSLYTTGRPMIPLAKQNGQAMAGFGVAAIAFGAGIRWGLDATSGTWLMLAGSVLLVMGAAAVFTQQRGRVEVAA